jgi:asparagine synthase (glutamine-hydrolysing)
MSSGTDRPVNTFTIGFGGDVGGFDDERRYARLVAQRYNANHREHEVQPRLEGLLKTIVRAFDEPFADDGAVPSYFVSQQAREQVTVALSGLGGDELFCGYERYLGFRLGRIYSRVPGLVRDRLVRPFIEALPEPSSGGYRVNHLKRFVRGITTDPARQYLGFVTKINGKYRKSLFSRQGHVYGVALDAVDERFIKRFNSTRAEDALDKVFACDLATYLPDDILACTDRLSMSHSLEVRVPFLDHELVEYCATIPAELKMKWFRKKYLLKRGVRSLLPREVLEHRKQGFVGPLARWLRTDLRAFTRETLSSRRLECHGLFEPRVVERLLDDHETGRELNDTTIWALLIFQTWFEEYMN